MTYTIIIETHRLVLREATVDDAKFMHQILNDPDFIQFVGDRGIKTLDDARTDLENRVIKSYREHGFGFYITCLRGSMIPIGLCGLAKRDFLDDVDVGFAFLPEYRKAGYAYESAAAVIEYAKSRLGLNRIVAMVSPDNGRSIALLEKLGLSYDRPFRHPDDEKDIALYSWG